MIFLKIKCYKIEVGKLKIGILAIQGDFYLHQESLNMLNVESVFVKKSKDLAECDGLIIPGGESSTMSLLINKYSLYDDILKFSYRHSLFGTCAGSIIMSDSSNDLRIKNMSCVNLKTVRNAWGRQIDSFSDDITFTESFNIKNKSKYHATFIRAPKFLKIAKDCKILATYNKEPVLIRNNKHLVSSFHPEINNSDLVIFKYFLDMINE